MNRQFRIVCRGSKLSLAQAEIFRMRLLSHDPVIRVDVVIKETKGDANQDIALQDIEGKDFFTKDIQDYLASGQADFAVHSLKDVSGENFFHGHHFAVIERDDPRDAVIFNEAVIHKMKSKALLKIGTSSPRRVEMAIGFLQQALPVWGGRSQIVSAIPIRGNVDSRLQKLSFGDYDGIILACAGLNRLLRSEARGEILQLLKGTRLMILPLTDCPPAPGQGAIVVETTSDNSNAVSLLKAINNKALAVAMEQERTVAHFYGAGCHQKFGAIHIETAERSFISARGRDRNDNWFDDRYAMEGTKIERNEKPRPVNPSDPFFRHHQVALITPQDADSVNGLGLIIPGKKIWTSETSVWFDLAKKGIWVEGSMEGFGMPFVEKTMRSPLALSATQNWSPMRTLQSRVMNQEPGFSR